MSQFEIHTNMAKLICLTGLFITNLEWLNFKKETKFFSFVQMDLSLFTKEGVECPIQDLKDNGHFTHREEVSKSPIQIT